MAAELTKVYRTADGRLFERDQRDAARSHDAWLELVAWVNANMPIDESIDGEPIRSTPEMDREMANHMAAAPELAAILKRKPTEAAPP